MGGKQGWGSHRQWLGAAILVVLGVVLMIGGNIPDRTRVVSVQIYDHVEALEYTQAHWLSGGMLLFSFVVLLALYTFNPTRRKPA